MLSLGLTSAMVLALAVLCAAAMAAQAAESSHRERVHDPSRIVKCQGEYWVFATGRGVSSWHSADLVDWSAGPRVFTNPPAWTGTTVPESRGYFWAPDAIQIGERYYLYYSVSTWGKNTSAIGLATTPTLDPTDQRFGWQDRGAVFRSSPGDSFNAIDPSVLLEGNHRLWLAFGSYWTGIKLVELDSETGRRKSTNSPIYSLAWNNSIEAAALDQHGSNYYLFVNWGQCCRGTNSTYEIRVGRSSSISGPYLDRNGKDMLQGGGSLYLRSEGPRIGPGHAGILREGSQELFSYHFYDGERAGKPTLAIRRLQWSAEGWPEPGPLLPIVLK